MVAVIMRSCVFERAFMVALFVFFFGAGLARLRVRVMRVFDPIGSEINWTWLDLAAGLLFLIAGESDDRLVAGRRLIVLVGFLVAVFLVVKLEIFSY